MARTSRKDLSENQKIVQDDILRYKTNKLASLLAILGIVFNCLYFMLLYGLNNDYFYNIEIGISIILTLAVLLSVFLSSEGIKKYNKTYSIVLLVVAAIQVIRLIVMPILAVNGISWFAPSQFQSDQALAGHYFEIELTPIATCIILVIYLAASAGCLVASAVIGYIYAKRLETFTAKVESGEISIESALAGLEAEDAMKAEQTVSETKTEEPAQLKVAEPLPETTVVTEENEETESVEASEKDASNGEVE